MRLVTQEQIVINVKLDTMVMEIHVLPTHKTTPASGSATTADQCKLTLF